MTATIELNSARKKLSSVLGESQTEYFTHLKNWFRKRISKENFDTEARRLLAKEHAHLHNEFLLAILNKCQTLANFTPTTAAASAAVSNAAAAAAIKTEFQVKSEMTTDRIKRGKIKSKQSPNNRASFDQRFHQQQQMTNGGLDYDDAEFHEEERTLRFCYREPTLPDIAFIHGRMLVMAWEEKLEGVEDKAVEIIVQAVETQLRKMVMALIMKRKGYKVREGHFPHSVGAKMPNPWLQNAQNRLRGGLFHAEEVAECAQQQQQGEDDDDPLVPAGRPTMEDAEQRAVFEVACSVEEDEARRRPISLFDLMRLLQERKSIVPCHSVHAKNLERVIARLHHSGHDD